MPENLIFTEREINFLKELLKEHVDFMIVGLSAAALQGAPIVTQDIDLWFKNLSDSGIQRALKKVGGIYIPPINLNPPMFAGDAVNLFDIVLHMDGLDTFEKEEKNSIKIPIEELKVKVLSLERIIESKKIAGRQKDKLVLPVLADALISIREKGG
ncbi:MAG: hypothetical protein V1872_05075 [bacterium]